MILKENVWLLTDKMKKTAFLILTVILCSCTSNSILEKPKDLIPKDTMSLLVQELMKASSAKFIKNKNLQKNINYMPFVYDRFNIDSSRFKRSNFYYMSTIDDYIKIYDDAKKQLEQKKKFYSSIKKEQDSLRRDSITKVKKAKEPALKKLEKDSTKKDLNLDQLEELDSLPKN